LEGALFGRIWDLARITSLVLMLATAGVAAWGRGTKTHSVHGKKGPSHLVITTSSVANGQVGVSYQASLSASGGISPYSWLGFSGSLPPGIGLISTAGTLSGTPTTAGTFSFTVEVLDSGGQSAKQSFSLCVAAATPAPSPLVISTTSLPSGTADQPYSAALQASGGTTPYSWKLGSGQLPPGLSLSSGGQISGAPTAGGQYGFSVTVIDSAGSPQSTTASLAISVATAAPATTPALAITTNSLPQGTVNQSYSVALQASGGTTPYNWSLSSGQLPAGLSLSASGQISGTPSTAGQSSFTVEAADSSTTAQVATAALTLSIGSAAALDEYGGRTDLKCASATGYFHVEKISNRWWFCTPLGNAMLLTGVYHVAPVQQTDDEGNNYFNVVAKKYGDTGPTWAEGTAERLKSWGFNALGPYASTYILATATDNSYPLDANGLHSIPTKLPFIMVVRPGYYSMTNPSMYLSSYTNATLLSEAVKNMFYGMSPYYAGYRPGAGVPDYYDANIYTWLQKDLSNEMVWSQIRNSRYLPYLIGINSDDGDQMYGFGAGDAFATSPAGHNNANLSWIVATLSPVQTANSQFGQVYSHTTVYTKKAWRDFLAAKYGTIAALNAAWGSNYTTFDSSGTSVAGESVGLGNGSTVNYSHALAQLTPSKFSVEILVNGVAVGGDTGNGVIYGPQVSGTINYSTGALCLNFTTTPPAGATITVNYIQNGWGIGTGLLDEDGRTAHQAWLGSDYTYLSDTAAAVKTDMNAFLGQVAGEYFSHCRTGIKQKFPNTLYLGPDSLSTWSAPSRAAVLDAAGQSLDVMVGGGAASLTQPMLDYIQQHFGDKPYFSGTFLVANPDSALANYSGANVGGLNTQSARGQAYSNVVIDLQTSTTSNGVRSNVGSLWWEYVDNWGEKLDWGLVSNLDNAYDGKESVTSSVVCAPPLQNYVCGGEPNNYGDVITSVEQANSYWLTH
jgi:hypothetical protein